MTMKTTLMGAAAAVAMMTGATTAVADSHELTVAYFLEWPMPFEFAKVNGDYEAALGMPINWVSFDTGTAMSAAMASGDVHISVSQGIPPFVVAASAGQDLQVLDVAVSYAENDNCVVASALEIDATSAAELAGKKVAVPLGTAAHYGFLRQMDHFGVDVSTLEVVDMAPADGAAAIAVQASTTASAVAIYEDSATVACVATATATCNRVQSDSATIVCAASVVANGRKKWEDEPSTPEDWSAVSPTSTDWTPATASGQTWADAA